MCSGTCRPPSGNSSATCVESTFQHFNALSTVRRSTISTMRRQATSTSSCSTAKCDVFSTYTLRSRRGLDVTDVTTVGGCPSRHATLNEVVGDSSVGYRRTLNANDKANFQAARAAARKAIAQSRTDAITKQFADVAGDHAATWRWRVTRHVLHRGKQPYFSDTDCRSLVDDSISASYSPTRCTGYGILSSPNYINLPAQSLLHASISGLH